MQLASMRSREWQCIRDFWLPEVDFCLSRPVNDSNEDEDQRDECWQPRLMGVSSHDAEDRIDEPEGGDDEPDG